MLKQLQDTLPEVWTEESYGSRFQSSSVEHKDFQHAALHIMKTLGKLSSFIDEADHAEAPSKIFFPKPEVEKYLSDLVICAARMALTNPSGEIDLEEAVKRRFLSKMGRSIS